MINYQDLSIDLHNHFVHNRAALAGWVSLPLFCTLHNLNGIETTSSVYLSYTSGEAFVIMMVIWLGSALVPGLSDNEWMNGGLPAQTLMLHLEHEISLLTTVSFGRSLHVWRDLTGCCRIWTLFVQFETGEFETWMVSILFLFFHSKCDNINNNLKDSFQGLPGKMWSFIWAFVLYYGGVIIHFHIASRLSSVTKGSQRVLKVTSFLHHDRKCWCPQCCFVMSRWILQIFALSMNLLVL